MQVDLVQHKRILRTKRPWAEAVAKQGWPLSANYQVPSAAKVAMHLQRSEFVAIACSGEISASRSSRGSSWREAEGYSEGKSWCGFVHKHGESLSSWAWDQSPGCTAPGPLRGPFKQEIPRMRLTDCYSNPLPVAGAWRTLPVHIKILQCSSWKPLLFYFPQVQRNPKTDIVLRMHAYANCIL